MNGKRKSPEYKQWRNDVKHRDGNTCRRCGFGSNLHVHHIKPLNKYPEFALELDNGLTLCGNCHSLLGGKEESTNLRAFLGSDTKIDGQLRVINGSFSNYLERKLKSRSQHTRNDIVSKLFFHLRIYPDSIDEMLPLLIYIIDSENWTDESDVKRQAIEWLQRKVQMEQPRPPSTNWQLNCPNIDCQQKLRIPVKRGKLRLTCPKCRTFFEQEIRVQTPAVIETIIIYEQSVITLYYPPLSAAIGAIIRYEHRAE